MRYRRRRHFSALPIAAVLLATPSQAEDKVHLLCHADGFTSGITSTAGSADRTLRRIDMKDTLWINYADQTLLGMQVYTPFPWQSLQDFIVAQVLLTGGGSKSLKINRISGDVVEDAVRPCRHFADCVANLTIAWKCELAPEKPKF